MNINHFIFNKLKKKVGLILLALLIFSCERNELSSFVNSNIQEQATPTTYENTVKAILDNACVECHRPGMAAANVLLDNFKSARAHSPRMLVRILDTEDPMPPSGNLPSPIIESLVRWVENGALENDSSTPSMN